VTPQNIADSQGAARVTVSIVSHGHGDLVRELLEDLAQHCGKGIHVLLTLNIPENLTFEPDRFAFGLTVIRNAEPRGFGANHNAAFRQSHSPFFCVLNPDIHIAEDPFPGLIRELQVPRAGLVAPRIVNPDGETEDSARRFPTIPFLMRKALGLARKLDYEISTLPLSPDWVAGMFMLLRSETFAAVGGFDERYFLYYEDVDLCRRLRRRGYDVRLTPSVIAVHDARRESRRSLRHLRWHLASALRFLFSR
jgi:GT2 family glycosyltransferase